MATVCLGLWRGVTGKTQTHLQSQDGGAAGKGTAGAFGVMDVVISWSWQRSQDCTHSSQPI